MSVLAEDKVLRVNCPGFGVSTTLPLGEAKPLAMYDVIVMNPTSILHLFDAKSDLVKQIETLQGNGTTAFQTETDAPVEAITAELDLRLQELSQFLKKGGLLIFFLAPPFTTGGPNIQLDNYAWLGEWCPDKPTDAHKRNMSATIRGKTMEVVETGVWTPYLKQQNLEWTTIIRLEHLTQGFTPLALAGQNKCIAGTMSTGPKLGQVVFLPAPYNPECDARLKECIEWWYALHNGDEAAAEAIESRFSSLLKEGDNNESEERFPSEQQMLDQPPFEELASVFDENQEPLCQEPEDLEDTQEETEQAPVIAESPTPEVPAAEATADETPTAEAAPECEPVAEVKGSPEPDQLIKRMQCEIADQSIPDWCSRYSFEELDALKKELTEVNEEIQRFSMRAGQLESRIKRFEELKNILLSAPGEVLNRACTQVFEQLGWQVKPAVGNSDELWLLDEDKTQAIVRLIYTTSQPNRNELAALAESVITYWGAHEVEPKGILVVSTWADKPIEERPDEDFSESMSEFAKRKNLCLLTTGQLLSIFQEVEIRGVEAKEIRENLLTTSGPVADYVFNKKGISPVPS